MLDNTITRAMSRDGNARIIIINSKAMVNDAIRIHGLSPTAAAALGRTLTAASMIGVMLKDKDDSVTLTFNGDGSLGKMLAVSDYYGNARGFVQNPKADLPLNKRGKLDVAGIIGKGTLSIVKDMGEGQPFVGLVPIVSGEIAEDVTNYFATSEQTPTVCALGVLVGTDFKCACAGGFLIQLLPNADNDFIDKLEARVPLMPPVSQLFSSGKPNSELLKEILGEEIEFDVFDEIDVSYHCNCSKERVERVIASLGSKEIGLMIEEEKDIDVSCQFCDNIYTFNKQDLERILKKSAQKDNEDE